MTATVMHADSRALPLADNSVDLVITSPPYFALRSYTDDGVHYERQIGAEESPDAYVGELLAVTRECMRVLKPTGSLWVNLGDKYAQAQGQYPMGHSNGGINASASEYHANAGIAARRQRDYGIRPKSLVGIPWRYALRCVDELGLIWRAEIIWSKPNGLPESVTDRVRRSHEVWLHFTLQPRYFSAVDEIRERYAPETAARYASGYGGNSRATQGMRNNGVHRAMAEGDAGPSATNPLGKLPGSVWEIPTEPLHVPLELGVDHYAAFPTEWPRRIILGWSPSGVCSACGEGRRPVAEAQMPPLDLAWRERQGIERDGTNGLGNSSLGTAAHLRARTITGYACACAEPTADTLPAVVLDPFGGTGTTALVADVLGRDGISVDLSGDYCRIAEWRTSDPAQRAHAARKPKPARQLAGQADLLTLLDDESEASA